MVGVAHVEGKGALFFALSGYTQASVEFANRAGAALFVYDYVRGTLTAWSEAAKRALAEGLQAITPSSQRWRSMRRSSIIGAPLIDHSHTQGPRRA